MAHMKTDVHSNDENSGIVSLQPSKSFDEAATRKHALKKQALGDVKNVIHNQCPPKGQKSAEVPSKSNKEYDIHNQRNKPQQEASTSQNSTKSSTSPTTLDEHGIEMLDYFDFDRKCCRQPYKSERQIWADMNVFNESMLDKIILNTFAGDDEKHHDDDHFDLDKSDSENILDVNSSKLFPAIFSANDDDGSDDILLPRIELEKLDFS